MYYLLISTFLIQLLGVRGNVIDDFVNSPDPEYNWYEVKNNTFRTIWGGTAHVLNVTSQAWKSTEEIRGVDGHLWTHQVVVIIPRKLKYTNVSFAMISENYNNYHNAK